MPPLEGGKEGDRAAMVLALFCSKLEESKRAAGILFVSCGILPFRGR